MSHFNKSKKHICFFVIISLAILILMISRCSHKSDDLPTAPESIESLISDGWKAFQAGDYNKAIQDFEKTIKRNVDPAISIDAYRGLGWTYSRVEKYSQAITNFNFVISLETDQYIVDVEKVESYSAKIKQKLGPAPAFILEAGMKSINLPRAEVSNAAGTGLGTPLDNSIKFNPDSLKTPVNSPENLLSLYDFYLDALKGVIEIKPRIYKLENIFAQFRYHEKGYLIKRTENQLVVLEDELENLTDTPADSAGDIYYLKGNFYNKYTADNPSSGGTYLQADAYAGMAAVYLAQGDYSSAMQAARTLIYINQDLKSIDTPHYPYQRSLFEADNSFDLWDYYKLLAICYFNLYDYRGAEKCLEIHLNQGDIVDNTKPEFIFELLTKINSLPDDAPSGWTPANLW